MQLTYLYREILQMHVDARHCTSWLRNHVIFSGTPLPTVFSYGTIPLTYYFWLAVHVCNRFFSFLQKEYDIPWIPTPKKIRTWVIWDFAVLHMRNQNDLTNIAEEIVSKSWMVANHLMVILAIYLQQKMRHLLNTKLKIF